MFHSFHNCCQSFLFSHRNKLGLKRHMNKYAKMQDICNKETKTTAASLVCWLRDKILYYEQAKCVKRVATSLKHSFCSVREHLQFSFNSNVFIDQMFGYVPCMVRFVLKRGPFCPKTWSVLSFTWSVLSCHGPFCPWSVLSMVRFVPNSSVIGSIPVSKRTLWGRFVN